MSDDIGAVAEAPEVDVTPAPMDTATPAATPEAPAAADPAKPEDQEQKQDKRRYPDAWRKTLKFLKDSGGEFAPHATSIHKALGESFGYKELFPTVQDARTIKAQLDAVGGPAKVAELHAAYQHMEQLDNSIKAGDPSSLDEIFEMAPEGMAKLLPNIMERIEKQNPEAYQKTIQPHAFKYMTNAGFGITLGDLITAINGQDTDGIKRHAKLIRDWFADGAQAATPQEQPVNEWEQKYKAREAEERQKADIANTEKHVQASVDHAGPLIDDALRQHQAKLQLGEGALELLRKDIWAEMQARRNKDDEIMRPIRSIWHEQRKTWTADPGPFFKIANQKYAKEATDHVVNLRYGHHLKQTATQPNPTAPVKRNVTATPPRPVAPQQGRRQTFEDIINSKVPQLRGQ